MSDMDDFFRDPTRTEYNSTRLNPNRGTRLFLVNPNEFLIRDQESLQILWIFKVMRWWSHLELLFVWCEIRNRWIFSGPSWVILMKRKRLMNLNILLFSNQISLFLKIRIPNSHCFNLFSRGVSVPVTEHSFGTKLI